MMRVMSCAVALLVSCLCSISAVQAQTEVEALPDQWQYEVRKNGFTAGYADFSVRFRNLQPAGESRLFALQTIALFGGCDRDCLISFGGASRGVGAIDGSTIALADGTQILGNVSWNGSSSTTSGSIRVGPSGNTPVLEDLGVIGCTLPDPAFAQRQLLTTMFYRGRTCAADGFDGWMEFDFGLFLDGPTLTPESISADQIEVRALGSYYDVARVPEPSSLALQLAALAVIAAAALARSGRRRLGAVLFGLCVALPSQSASAQTVSFSPGVTYEADAFGVPPLDPLTDIPYRGYEFRGMQVEIGLADGSVISNGWTRLEVNAAGVGTDFDFYQMRYQRGTRFSFAVRPVPWAAPTTFIRLHGAPGRTLFVCGWDGFTCTDGDGSVEGTPGSGLGRTLALDGTSAATARLEYRNQVGIGGAAPVGDLFEQVTVHFEQPFSSGGVSLDLGFAFTDHGAPIPSPVSVPEPSSAVVLLGFGMMAARARWRRRRGASPTA